MVVWKSSPNGKSEPISRRNNSLLRNLNGSELTFVSCQVQSSGGWEGLQQRSCTLHYKVPVLNPPKVVGPQDFLRQRTYLSAYSARAHPSSVICYGSCTVDLIQEHTLALWPWEERWSREEWTVLPELARALTLSWPHFFSFVVVSLSCSSYGFLSLWAAEISLLFVILLWVPFLSKDFNIMLLHISLEMTSFTWCHTMSLSPSLPSVCYGGEKLSGVSASPI